MSYRWLSGTFLGLFDAVFRPSKFVTGRVETGGNNRLFVVRRSLALTAVYIVNLALYATPLTLTGFGVDESATPPAWFADSAVAAFGNPAAAWRFLMGFVQNSAFLFVATILTLMTFHASVVLTRASRGLLKTVYTVVYSTSAYLAGIFTVVWYLSTNEGVAAARDLVIAAQGSFIYFFIDALNADLGLPTGRPEPVDPSTLTADGTTILAILIVMAVYYIYSMYLGSRINHNADRLTGLLVVTFVALSPALYVVGLVIVYSGGLPL